MMEINVMFQTVQGWVGVCIQNGIESKCRRVLIKIMQATKGT